MKIRYRLNREQIYPEHPWNIPRLTIDAYNDIKNAKVDVKIQDSIKMYWNCTWCQDPLLPFTTNYTRKGQLTLAFGTPRV